METDLTYSQLFILGTLITARENAHQEVWIQAGGHSNDVPKQELRKHFA